MLASFLTLGVLVFSSVVADIENQSRTAAFARSFVDDSALETLIYEIGAYQQSDAVIGAAIAILTSTIMLSYIHIGKIPNIRRIAIEAIAYGYYENFLIGLAQFCSDTYTDYRIIIIVPDFQLVETPKFYINRLKKVIKDLGFEMTIQQTDQDFGRHAYLVFKKDHPPLPLYVDIPTTMRVLTRILELEAHMPVGKLVERKWWRKRFSELAHDFANVIRNYMPEDDWGNVVFIESSNKEDFIQKLKREILDLEKKIASRGT
jgi:hypothetical protein